MSHNAVCVGIGILVCLVKDSAEGQARAGVYVRNAERALAMPCKYGESSRSQAVVPCTVKACSPHRSANLVINVSTTQAPDRFQGA